MPVNKTNPLEKILKEFERIEFKYRNPLTIEYVLISGVNDSMDEADRIADIAERLRARINLIPLNKIELFNGEPSDESTIQAFMRRLVSNNINVTVRRSKGQAIGAACGQLKVSSEEGADDKKGIAAG
jgi:23S rRNA (adenine2503-C2)-methyltransferase